MEAENISYCPRCHSANQNSFTAEVAVHFPGLQGLGKPIVWVFPNLLVCLECGRSEFTVSGRELKVLQTGLPVEGAVVWRSEGDHHNRS